jgi:hypothetical protein
VGKVKQWFYKDKAPIDTWSKCSAAFLAKFFPVGKTNAPEAWERLQEYIQPVPTMGWKAGWCSKVSTMG